MKYIKITLVDNSCVFETLYEKVNCNSEELIYSFHYVKKNISTISNELSKYKYETCTFKDFECFQLACNIVNFKQVIFEEEKSLPKRVMDTLLEKDNLNYVKCYFMPSDYVHIFAKKNVSIKFTNNSSFDISFAISNDLKSLKSLYYKKVIRFYTEEEIKNNLMPFLGINRNLKLIHIYTYSNEIMDFIIESLEKYNFSDVSIYIHQNENNMNSIKENITYLRNVNKEFNKKLNGNIKIIYSEEFFRDRIWKELTLNGVKLSLILIVYASVVFMFSSKYHEYKASLNLRKLEMELNSNDDRLNSNIDEIDDTAVTEVIIKPDGSGKEYVNKYDEILKDYDEVLKINSDVVGWVTVNDTKINYPVVQTSNNKYYLNHDIYKNSAVSGWVFMDYRNNSKDLDKNTILYAHAMTTGYMFGELWFLSKSSFRSNPDKLLITFNTLNTEMKWRVFATYKVSDEVDYLKTSFSSDDDFMSYVNEVKGRSSYNFGIDVKPGDKILTMSTCSGKNRRLVVHAVLVK